MENFFFHKRLSSSELYRDHRLFKGIAFFNRGEWYQCHDVFESLWIELSDPEKSLIQSLLQIAVAQLHLEKNNLHGATIIISQGLMNLELFDPSALGINLNDLHMLMKTQVKAIQQKHDLKNLELPHLNAYGKKEDVYTETISRIDSNFF